MWFESGYFGNYNLLFFVIILEKCFCFKERFFFIFFISVFFGMWEYMDLLIYFFCWIWKWGFWMIGYLRMLFKLFWWNNIKICDIVIYVYILMNFIYKFWWLIRVIINVIFEVILYVMNLFFKLIIEGCILIYFIFILYKIFKLWWK